MRYLRLFPNFENKDFHPLLLIQIQCERFKLSKFLQHAAINSSTVSVILVVDPMHGPIKTSALILDAYFSICITSYKLNSRPNISRVSIVVLLLITLLILSSVTALILSFQVANSVANGFLSVGIINFSVMMLITLKSRLQVRPKAKMSSSGISLVICKSISTGSLVNSPEFSARFLFLGYIVSSYILILTL